jgi:hypothetical protein
VDDGTLVLIRTRAVNDQNQHLIDDDSFIWLVSFVRKSKNHGALPHKESWVSLYTQPPVVDEQDDDEEEEKLIQ